MKKIILIASMVSFLFSISRAQLSPVVKNPGGVKITKTLPPAPSPAPAPAPPPAPVQKTTGTTVPVTPTYTLTSVRVSIRTGSDNKEFPSKVFVTIQPRNTPAGGASAFNQLALSNEMRINSDTEFGLERSAQYPGDASLESFLSSGFKLRVSYFPNFFADAWKIENVTVILEFKDQNGNLHPSLSRKTVLFSTATGFLNNDYRELECFADGNFMPITTQIRR